MTNGQKIKAFILSFFDNKLQGKPGEDYPLKTVRFKHRMNANVIDFMFLMPILHLFALQAYQSNHFIHSSIVNEADQNVKNGEITQEDYFEILMQQWLESLDINALLMNYFLTTVVLGLVYIYFWKRCGGTPGKMLLNMRIVDNKTLDAPRQKQLIFRYIGFLLCVLTAFLGFFWILVSKNNRGLHDYVAGTVVIYCKPADQSYKDKRFKRQTYVFCGVFVLIVLYLMLQRL